MTTTVTIPKGDSFPNFGGIITWPGTVKTDTITGVLIANGKDTGRFTGEVNMVDNITAIDSYGPGPGFVPIGGVPIGEVPAIALLSSWSWAYDVDSNDTKEVASYKLQIRLTHDNGDIETLDPNFIVEVEPLG